MRITAYGSLLTAASVDRTLTYRLLPYGEQGRTNVGRVTASAGALTLPASASELVLNMQHDGTRPVGRGVALAEDATGLTASFRIAATSAGDDLLAEAAEGLRTGVSVEIDDPVIRGGRLVAGRLTGAGAVVAPAFPSAQLVAADAGDDTQKATEGDQLSDDAAEAAGEESQVDEDQAADQAGDEQDDKLTASLPGSLRKSGVGKKVATLFASLAAAKSQGERVQLLAALDQIVPADALPAQQQAWLGEVYASRTYVRRFSPLLQHDNLSALKAIGWKFTTGKTPQVADYAGYPAQPNSNEVKTEAVTLDALRLAGAGEVDRAFIDFPTPEFWAGYYRECTNDYERKADQKARDAVIAGATAVTAGTVPSGVAKAAAFLVDGAMAIIDAERDLPSWALVGSGLYRELLLTRADDVLAYLRAALGLADGELADFRIVPSSVATLTNKVLVGTATAATQYELPGSPIRLETVNIANGGVQTGVFGYHAELVNDATGLALVSAGA